MSDARPGPRGPQIIESSVSVHRQIRPTWWVQEGRPSSQTFRPLPKDAGLLSLADGRKRSPEQAYRFHVETLGFDSVGTLSLSVSDFESQGIKVHEDELVAADDGHDDPAHVSADFRQLGNSEQKRAAAFLLLRAGAPTYRP